jgi:hypothetical protein
MIPASVARIYQEAKYIFPDTEMSPEDRNALFFLTVAQGFFCDFVNDRTMRPYNNWSGGRSYEELRRYAQGQQSPQKYQNILCPPTKKKKKGNPLNAPDVTNQVFMNISWDTVKVMPKIVDTITGLSTGIKFKATAVAVDDSSITKKGLEKAFYELQLDPAYKEVKAMAQASGVQMPQPEMEFSSKSDIEMFYNLGGVKLGWELAASNALLSTERQSDMEIIKGMIIEDLVTLGVGVARDFIEPIDNGVKAAYVDPDNFTCNYSNYNDYRNMERAFEIRYMTMADLRRETTLSEEQIEDIALKYQGFYSSPYIGSNSQNQMWRDKTQNNNMLESLVPVVFIKFIATDLEKYSKVNNKRYGNLSVRAVKGKIKLSENDKKDQKEIIENKVEYVYKTAWVPGTDCVFDYGKDYDIVREGPDGLKRAKLPYHVYKTQKASIVERCIPFIDDICLAVYKKRNVVAKIPSLPALAINTAVMRNLTLGGYKMDPLEALDLFGQAGTLFFEGQDDHGKYVGGYTSSPITPLPIGTELMNALNAFNMEIDKGMENIRLVSGVNEFIDGTTAPERLGLGVAELAAGATNNTLRSIFKGYETILKNVMGGCLLRWQLVAATDGYKGKVMSIGEQAVKTFQLSKDFAIANFGVSVEILPSEMEKAALMQKVTGLGNLNFESNGEAGLSPDVVFALERLIRADNIVMAQFLLAKAVKEQRARAEQKQKDMMAMNAQAQQQAVEAGNQGKIQAEQLKAKAGAEQALISAEGKTAAAEIQANAKVETP